jgi:hypothetical protein
MLTRADIYRIVDELPDDEISELSELLRRRGVSIARLSTVAFKDEAGRFEARERGIDVQIEGMKRAVETGPQSITLRAFVDFLRANPAPDDQFADDLEAIRREQGSVEPVDWPS